MNKSDKKYTVDRIDSIKSEKLIRCECQEPNLRKALIEAAIRGELKMKLSTSIKEEAREKALRTSRYDTPALDFHQLFQEPDSYKKEIAEHKAEQAKHKAKNDTISAWFNDLIDRVNLGRFENGEDAIAEALAYKAS